MPAKHSAIEDLWIECQCYKELVLDSNSTPSEALQDLLKEAKSNPETRAKAKKAVASLG